MANLVQKGIVGLAALVTLLAPVAPRVISNPTYAQPPASPRINTIDRRIEHVPYTEYRRVIEERGYTLVTYYSSTHDAKDAFRQEYTANEHAFLLIDHIIQMYGNTIKRFAVVDLPFNKIGGDILNKEVGKPIGPSFVLYRDGKPVTRWINPPTDKTRKEGYTKYHDDLRNIGISPS